MKLHSSADEMSLVVAVSNAGPTRSSKRARPGRRSKAAREGQCGESGSAIAMGISLSPLLMAETGTATRPQSTIDQVASRPRPESEVVLAQHRVRRLERERRSELEKAHCEELLERYGGNEKRQPVAQVGHFVKKLRRRQLAASG